MHKIRFMKVKNLFLAHGLIRNWENNDFGGVHQEET